MEEEDAFPVVIDSSSGLIKAGFAGEDTPRAVFPNVLARPPYQGIRVGMGQMDIYVGDEVYGKSFLTPEYPIEHGIVTDWDDMGKIWHHTFYNELHVAPEEHPVLLTEAPLNPKANREKLTQIMFETFDVPAMYVANSQVLSLHSQGCITGLVVDLSYKSSHIVPIYRGHVLTSAVLQFDIGVQQLTEYLTRLLTDIEHPMFSGGTIGIGNDIRTPAQLLSALRSLEKEERPIPFMFKLPDGQEIFVKDERIRCLEPLFNPSIVESVQEGIHAMIDKSIQKTDPDIHKYLYSNIVLAGGSALFPQFAERLHSELSGLIPHNTHVNIREPPNRKYSACIGGLLLAGSDCFEKICLSKDCYEEHGPSIIHRKYF